MASRRSDEGRGKRRPRAWSSQSKGAVSAVLPVVPPPQGLAGALDEVQATVLALLASLAQKERVLRGRAGAKSAPGVAHGLADIEAIRRWANRILQTIEVLNAGQQGELSRLLDELGEFERIVHA
jgi:hypothetical protein